MTISMAFYTFNAWHNTTYKLGRLLTAEGYRVYFLRNSPLSQIRDMAIHHTHFIGLGDFMKTAKKIRVETTIINLYGKKPILINGKESYSLFDNFQLPSDMYFSSTTTNGRCNKAAYLLASYTDHKKTTFLHIPRGFDIQKAKTSVQKLTAQLLSVV